MADLTDEELAEYLRDCGHMMNRNRITVADHAICMAHELQRHRAAIAVMASLPTDLPGAKY